MPQWESQRRDCEAGLSNVYPRHLPYLLRRPTPSRKLDIGTTKALTGQRTPKEESFQKRVKKKEGSGTFAVIPFELTGNHIYLRVRVNNSQEAIVLESL